MVFQQYETRRTRTRLALFDPNSDGESELPETSLETRVRNALSASGYFDSAACEIRVHVSPEGHVSLRGVVSSYYLKQRAQVAAMSVDGIRSLQNELVVR